MVLASLSLIALIVWFLTSATVNGLWLIALALAYAALIQVVWRHTRG